MSEPAGTDAALREISRALRQICLLQETGREEEAAQLEPVLLESLIQSFRSRHGENSLPEEQVSRMRACERERAGDAAALGELLAPLLLEQLGRRPDPPWTPPAPPSPAGASPARRPTATAPAVADLLDGMLAQDHVPAPRRPHLRT